VACLWQIKIFLERTVEDKKIPLFAQSFYKDRLDHLSEIIAENTYNQDLLKNWLSISSPMKTLLHFYKTPLEELAITPEEQKIYHDARQMVTLRNIYQLLQDPKSPMYGKKVVVLVFGAAHFGKGFYAGTKNFEQMMKEQDTSFAIIRPYTKAE
jgi:hypothetical protein